MTALPMPSTSARRPRGFTLVELLVVVGIIAVLAALVTPAVIRARSAARNAAIDTEIDLLHMAIMNYRNEYGSFPPCNSSLTLTSGPAGKHLVRLFPRITNVDAEMRNGVANPPPIDPSFALFVWLQGYTNDPTCPVTGTNSGGPRRKLFDFDQTRLRSGTYSPFGLQNSPYVYIDNTAYGTAFTIGTGTYSAVASGGAFFNADTFQILCAGQDQIWGNEDDLSNFWRGTRQQHAASSQ
jgi:prepilin-type N-terminal cleavage/methylation domain-containing protein